MVNREKFQKNHLLNTSRECIRLHWILNQRYSYVQYTSDLIVYLCVRTQLDWCAKNHYCFYCQINIEMNTVYCIEKLWREYVIPGYKSLKKAIMNVQGVEGMIINEDQNSLRIHCLMLFHLESINVVAAGVIMPAKRFPSLVMASLGLTLSPLGNHCTAIVFTQWETRNPIFIPFITLENRKEK